MNHDISDEDSGDEDSGTMNNLNDNSLNAAFNVATVMIGRE